MTISPIVLSIHRNTKIQSLNHYFSESYLDYNPNILLLTFKSVVHLSNIKRHFLTNRIVNFCDIKQQHHKVGRAQVWLSCPQ